MHCSPPLALVLAIASAAGAAGCDALGEGAGGDASGPYFTRAMFWNRDVSSAPVARDSASILAALRAAGGWGGGDRFRIDFTFDVLHADATTPRRAFTPTRDFFAPDCDRAEVPLPPGGNVEGEAGYACSGAGDCHLIVFEEGAGRLYEMWRADAGEAFQGGCLAVWDAGRAYPDTLRGDQCASADAAGFPIAPLLFGPDEVAAGAIEHAIRFVLPADRTGRGFVRPATHALEMAGPANAPPFGVHLRLRGDYPLGALPSEGARVVGRALQRYGMYHADRGNTPLTALSDRHTAAKWSGLLGWRDLEALRVEDFEVVDHGAALAVTFHCER